MMLSHFLGILAVLCGKTNAYVPQTFTTVCIFWWFQLCVISTPSSWEINNSMLTCTYLSNGWGNNDGTVLFDENIQSYYQRMIGYDWALQSLPQHSI